MDGWNENGVLFNIMLEGQHGVIPLALLVNKTENKPGLLFLNFKVLCSSWFPEIILVCVIFIQISTCTFVSNILHSPSNCVINLLIQFSYHLFTSTYNFHVLGYERLIGKLYNDTLNYFTEKFIATLSK